MSFKLHYPSLIIAYPKCKVQSLSKIILSRELHPLLIQMAAPVFPTGSSTFLDQFGTPTLLWRVLSSVGYPEAPSYTWRQAVPLGDVPWYVVTFIVPQNPTRPLWHGWSIETDGQSPWEAAQVAALDVLMDIAQSFGDELVGGPASSIPRVAPTEAEWTQKAGQALVRGRGECVRSDNAGMSAMMAILKLC